MGHKLRILQSVFAFMLLMVILFGALALLPALAQTPQHGRAAPDEPFAPEVGGLALPSTTGYVIDDGDTPGFSPSAPYPGYPSWQAAAVGYGGDCIYAQADSSGDVAEWRPDLAAGTYDVQVHWWADQAWQRDDAEYTVYYDGGSVTRLVDQQRDASGTLQAGANSGWYSLGRFPFAGGTSGYVTLSDITTTWGSGTNIVADAARFLAEEIWVDDSYCSSCTNDGHLWGVTAFGNIREGIMAVANFGTVYVGPGSYYQNITVTKSITLSGAGSATTVITVPSAANAAIEVLANDVRISGFTIQSAGASYGIINYDWTTGWAADLTGYRISNNTIRGFQYGIRFQTARGEINNNIVRNNSEIGIWVEASPSGAAVGPTTVSGNYLDANGGGVGGNDYDIRVEDSYTGTLVTANTITGSLGANEAGIYVLNAAGDLTLSANRISACSEGILILQNAGTGIIQKANLQGNAISGGTKGVRVRRTAGTASVRQITIGGSTANANSIYGDTSYELQLTGYSADITATHNYWGVCTLRGIEDEIYHDYDSAALGLVTYEPALCVPYTITVQAAPGSLPADGISMATITATARDVAGDPVRPGTMIGITTTQGSVPYRYSEAEDASAVTRNPPANWAVWTYGDERASNGSTLYSNTPGSWVSWNFTGEAVSLIYVTFVGGGTADVSVDGSYVKTINFVSTATQFRVEDLITNTLGTGQHTIRVTHQAAGTVELDAFRSGGAADGQGQVVTRLTSATTPVTATVWGTVYNGRIVTSTPPPYPIVTGTVSVAFQGTDVYISKSAAPTTLRPNEEVTYTISYGNSGPAAATSVLVTDTLPAGFLRVRSTSLPNYEPPSAAAGNKYVWTIGNLAPGATGIITLVARVDPAAPWPSTPAVRTNVAEIGTRVTDSAAGNNSGLAPVTVMPGPAAVVTVTAYPATILANGSATSTITATVKDTYQNPVADGTLVTFTTNLNTVFLPGAVASKVVSTTGGVATTTLQAGTVAGMATVVAKVGTVQGSTQVQLIALEPWWVYISASPSSIPASNWNIAATLYLTVTDQYDNRVNGATVTLTTTAGLLRTSAGITGTTLVVTTTNGITTASLFSSPTVTTATVTAAITTAGRPTGTVQVFFEPSPPYTVTSQAYPDELRVCGDTGVITATVTDAFGNPVSDGTSVRFTVIPAAAGYMDPTWRTTVNGVATSTLHTAAYSLSGGRELIVRIAAGTATQERRTDQRVGLTEGPANTVTFTRVPSRIEVGDKRSNITAWVQDCGGNNVRDGTWVNFSTNTDMGEISPASVQTWNGRADAIFRSACRIGTAVITATVDSRSFTTTVQIEPGPATGNDIFLVVEPPTIRNCGEKAVITATVYNRCGFFLNLVKDGTLVTFAPVYGAVRASPERAYTVNGVVTTQVTSLNKPLRDLVGNIEQISVRADFASNFATLLLRPGNPEEITLSPYPDNIPVNRDVIPLGDITIQGRVTDCSDTEVEDGTMVTLRTDLGIFRDSGTLQVVTPTVGGLITVTLTSQREAGWVTVAATADSAVGRTKVRFLPGDLAKVEVLPPVPPSIPADGTSTSRIIARVADDFDNSIFMDGITVTFHTTLGRFLHSGTNMYIATTLNGFAEARLVADTVPGIATVIADAGPFTNFNFVTFYAAHYLYLPIVRKQIP